MKASDLVNKLNKLIENIKDAKKVFFMVLLFINLLIKFTKISNE